MCVFEICLHLQREIIKKKETGHSGETDKHIQQKLDLARELFNQNVTSSNIKNRLKHQ